MQEKYYGLFQVSNARHRADLKLGSLDFVTLYFTVMFASLIPSDPALASTFTSDLYHASGCGHIHL